MDDMNTFKENYMKWLNENIEEARISDNIFRTTLPFLDRNNDMVDIYAIRQPDGLYRLTDDGATLNDLALGYINVKKEPNSNILRSAVMSYAVSISDKQELFIMSSLEDMPLKKHLLAQCMVHVSDMFEFNARGAKGAFTDDVRLYLDENKIRYSADMSVTGRSRLYTHYDFVIPKSANSCERFIIAKNSLSVNTSKNIIFSWIDTRDSRKEDAALYTFVRGAENISKKGQSDALSALREYDITPVLWTDRATVAELLAA